MWSVRLQKGVVALGHEAEVVTGLEESHLLAELAMVPLSNPGFELEPVLSQLNSAGILVLGHAGHKEKEAMKEGKTLGVDLVVTNGFLASNLDEVMEMCENEIGSRKSDN